MTPTPTPSHPTLIPKQERAKFIFLFAIVTALADALSILPLSVVVSLLDNSYPGPQPLPSPMGLLDIVLGQMSESMPGWFAWFGLLNGLLVQTVIGILVGVLQWFVLRAYLPQGNWILATVLGYELAGLVASAPGSPAIFYALVVRGVVQWRLLLRPLIRDSWIWLLAQPLGLLLDQILHVLLKDVYSTPLGWYGLSLGVIQAVMLCVLQRRSTDPGNSENGTLDETNH